MNRFFACSVDEIEKESSRRLDVGGEPVALFRNSDGEFYATADSCTHEQWSLGEDSDVDGNEITCPLHMARFDMRDGAALCFPATVGLATYHVEVDEDDNVYILKPS